MEHIQDLCDQIISLCHPHKIILFSRKTGLGGEVCSFKLCVITQAQDRRTAEREIYLHTDCDIPYDIVLYLPEEWEKMRVQEGSFAQKLDKTGRVMHG